MDHKNSYSASYAAAGVDITAGYKAVELSIFQPLWRFGTVFTTKETTFMDHKNSYSASYAAAGVDITAGYKAVELMKKHVARTRNEGCLDDVGGFGGCFGLNLAGMEEPVLVSGTDGCGTKVKLAILMDQHDTIGIDAVAMCVNDIICVGAKPLFFLDYIACGKNVPEKIAQIVSGVAEGCVQSGAALIGGETAEHPGRRRLPRLFPA